MYRNRFNLYTQLKKKHVSRPNDPTCESVQCWWNLLSGKKKREKHDEFAINYVASKTIIFFGGHYLVCRVVGSLIHKKLFFYSLLLDHSPRRCILVSRVCIHDIASCYAGCSHLSLSRSLVWTATLAIMVGQTSSHLYRRGVVHADGQTISGSRHAHSTCYSLCPRYLTWPMIHSPYLARAVVIVW